MTQAVSEKPKARANRKILEVSTPSKRARAAERAFDDPRTEKDTSHPRVTPQGDIKTGLVLVQDQLANDFMCYRNEQVQVLKEQFPYDREMHYVDRFYPHAKGGPLYLDSPQMKHEEKRCEKKAHVMLEAGLRYAFVLPTDYLEDVLERIADGVANRRR